MPCFAHTHRFSLQPGKAWRQEVVFAKFDAGLEDLNINVVAFDAVGTAVLDLATANGDIEIIDSNTFAIDCPSERVNHTAASLEIRLENKMTRERYTSGPHLVEVA